MAISRDGDGAVDDGTDEGPHEAGDALRDAGEELKGEGDGVDIWAVVGNDGEGEHDKAEFAESAKRGDDDGGKETADSGTFVAVDIDIVTVVDGHCGGNGCAKKLGEEEGED